MEPRHDPFRHGGVEGGHSRGDNVNAPIGERVSYWRQRRGMSQRALAGLAGIGQSYLTRIERGKRNVLSRTVVAQLAHALKVPPAELTGDEPAATVVTDVSDVEVLISAGRRADVVVVDSRSRRQVLKLKPDDAASFGLLVSAKAAAARRR